MTENETLDLISKQWCSLDDLMKLGQFSRNSALKVKREIKIRELYLAFYEYQKDKVKETTIHTYLDRMRYMQYLDNIKVKDFNLQHYEMWRKKNIRM